MSNSNPAYLIPSDLHAWALHHWHLVDRLAQRRFHDETTAQEASLFVMEKVSGNDWQRLRRFSGKAKFATFFCSVACRLLEDYARQKFGRLRVPAWLNRLGGIWLLFFRLLCQERYALHEAVQIAQSRYQQPQADNYQAIGEQILTEIPSCGKKQFEAAPLEEDTGVDRDQGCQSRQHHNLEEEERRQLLQVLAVSVFDSKPSEEITAPLAKLVASRLHLTANERLLLKLCHRDGRTVTEAGRMLGLNRFQIHGQLKRLYKRISEQLTAAGLAEELRELLKD